MKQQNMTKMSPIIRETSLYSQQLRTTLCRASILQPIVPTCVYTGLDRSLVLQEVKAPTISRQTAHKELLHQPTLMHNFLYSLTICLLHYYPRYVSSINMPIFRKKNCIYTASGIFVLCKRLHSTLVESGLRC